MLQASIGMRTILRYGYSLVLDKNGMTWLLTPEQEPLSLTGHWVKTKKEADQVARNVREMCEYVERRRRG